MRKEIIVYTGFERYAYIYGIKDKLGSIVYIGSTNLPIRQRINGHLSAAARQNHLPIHKWLNTYVGVLEIMCLSYVKDCDREEEEKRLIKQFAPRLNVTDGGKGMSGYRFAGTSHAKKISQKLKTGAFFECEKCTKRFWRKQKDIIRSHNKFCSTICSNTRHKI